jgi:hypothetical protein
LEHCINQLCVHEVVVSLSPKAHTITNSLGCGVRWLQCSGYIVAAGFASMGIQDALHLANQMVPVLPFTQPVPSRS